MQYTVSCSFYSFFLFFLFVVENAQSQTFTKDLKRGLSYDSKDSQDHDVLSMVRRPVVWFV